VLNGRLFIPALTFGAHHCIISLRRFLQMSHPKPSAKNAAGEISNFERFTRFVRAIVNVPGSEVKQQIEKEKQARSRKRAKTSPASRASNDRD
jgi:hypothetical protein